MTTTVDYPDLDAAIDAESWQWLQDAAPAYADAVAAEVKRGHEPGDIRRSGAVALYAGSAFSAAATGASTSKSPGWQPRKAHSWASVSNGTLRTLPSSQA